jgi:hypothetical protein
MTPTPQGLVQRAVRRDLERTRVVLSTQLSIARQRREALAHHLIWLLDLVSHEDEEIAAARTRLERAARDFFGSGDRVPRRDLLLAVSALARLQAERDDWVRPSSMTQLARQVHWLVDGLEARVSEHVTRALTPRGNLAPVRLRAEVYRYRKNLLWGGTPAYALARV